jgi:hypothetical protein
VSDLRKLALSTTWSKNYNVPKKSYNVFISVFYQN